MPWIACSSCLCTRPQTSFPRHRTWLLSQDCFFSHLRLFWCCQRLCWHNRVGLQVQRAPDELWHDGGTPIAVPGQLANARAWNFSTSSFTWPMSTSLRANLGQPLPGHCLTLPISLHRLANLFTGAAGHTRMPGNNHELAISLGVRKHFVGVAHSLRPKSWMLGSILVNKSQVEAKDLPWRLC